MGLDLGTVFTTDRLEHGWFDGGDALGVGVSLSAVALLVFLEVGRHVSNEG